MTKIIVSIYIRQSAGQSGWEGEYSKADFDRLITPLMVRHEAIIDRKNGSKCRYRIVFGSFLDVKQFRAELTKRVKLLHSEASYLWVYKDWD